MATRLPYARGFRSLAAVPFARRSEVAGEHDFAAAEQHPHSTRDPRCAEPGSPRFDGELGSDSSYQVRCAPIERLGGDLSFARSEVPPATSVLRQKEDHSGSGHHHPASRGELAARRRARFWRLPARLRGCLASRVTIRKTSCERSPWNRCAPTSRFCPPAPNQYRLTDIVRSGVPVLRIAKSKQGQMRDP